MGNGGDRERDEGTAPSDSPPSSRVAEGDVVALLTGDNCSLVRAGGERRKVRGMGVYSPSQLVGKEYGSTTRVGPLRCKLLRPDLPLILASFRRCAQVITPKDSMSIAGELGIGPGKEVLEVGVGSGFMTAVLLWFCTGEGRVVSLEERRDFAEVARSNLTSAGLTGGWDLVVGDAKELMGKEGRSAGRGPERPEERVLEGPFDCAVVDIPDPWEIVGSLPTFLSRGGKAAFYLPTYNQLERTMVSLTDEGFSGLVAREVLERGLKTFSDRIRPKTKMLGHTGFLLFARWA